MEGGKPEPARAAANGLASRLRGRVGELITSWLIMRNFMAMALFAKSDVDTDVQSRDPQSVQLMEDRLRDGLVARLLELAEPEAGQPTFYSATRALDVLTSEADAFTRLIRESRLAEREIPVPYRTLVGAVASAARLMKRIDRHVLGRSWL